MIELPCFSLFYLVSSVMISLLPLDSTYASPGPKIYKKCSSDYFHIVHRVERIALL